MKEIHMIFDMQNKENKEDCLRMLNCENAYAALYEIVEQMKFIKNIESNAIPSIKIIDILEKYKIDYEV